MSDTIKVVVKQISDSASEAYCRQHGVLMDTPHDREGEDKGPMGSELLLIAFGGCFMSSLLAVIRAKNADVSDISINLTGEIGKAPSRFIHIRIEISAKYRERKLIERLVVLAEQGCVVANTLKKAIDLTFSIV